MFYNLSEHDANFAYKLLTATIVPRPIAWVTTLNDDDTVNAAPFSFFNMVGANPPIVAVGMMANQQNDFKDSAHNIFARQHFVVNLVNETVAAQMNITGTDAPYGVSEIELAGLDLVASQNIQTPQIKQAPVALECVSHSTIITGPHQVLALGRVVNIRIDDDYILDAQRGYIDTPKLKMIGRMHARGFYSRTDNLFEIQRIAYKDYK